MNIYIQVVKLHFLQDMTAEAIAEIYYRELLDYKHQVHDKLLKFYDPVEAAREIIKCEKIAHMQAKSF